MPGASEDPPSRRPRPADVTALNKLLEGVVLASRALLEEAEFQQGLQAWLRFLGEALDADTAEVGALEPPTPGDPVANCGALWSRQGLPFEGRDIPSTTDFTAWAEQLRSGKSVFAHLEDLRDPLSVEFWGSSQYQYKSGLLMPVGSAGVSIGWLGVCWRHRRPWSVDFDSALRTAADFLASALLRQRAVAAMLGVREKQFALESARAEAFARQAARAERHSRLLAAVGESARELLAARDLGACMQGVLCRIGRVTAADRATLTRADWTPDDPELLGRQEITHEWAREGALRQQDTPHRWIEMRRDDATWAEMWVQLQQHGRLMARVGDLDEPFRSTQLSLGVVWNLCFPVDVGGVLRGLLGFDYSTPIEEHDEADLLALQAVASTLGGAFWRQELEQRALSAERMRADESERLADLLAHVVNSSRRLIDAEAGGFEPALKDWLGGFAEVTTAQRATFYDLAEQAPMGQRTARTLCEWVRDGLKGEPPASFARPRAMAPRAVGPLLSKLTTGQVVILHTEDITDPEREFLLPHGGATVIVVPMFMGGLQWGCLSLEHATRCELQSGDVAVLQTAADTLAVVLKRNQAVQQSLADRERRLLEETRRSADLAQANAALRASLAALADTQSEAGFLSHSLLQLAAQAGASGVYLFRAKSNERSVELIGAAAGGSFHEDGLPGDPPRFRQSCTVDEALLSALRAHGKLIWQRVDRQLRLRQDASEFTRWHLRMGHLASAQHALVAGERLVGLVCMVFDHDRAPSSVLQELLHALCQPLALALELARLSRSAQASAERAAVLAERERLAGEIHDNLAQNFTAIALHSASLAERLGDATQHLAALDLIERTARLGLAEARSAVLMLQPLDGAPGTLDRLLGQLAERSSVHGRLRCSFHTSGTPCALTPAVCESALRVAQEATGNAMRHSGGGRVRIRLVYGAADVRLSVEDDGKGGQVQMSAAGGYGLAGMSARASAMGGQLTLSASDLGGLAVTLSWPAPAAAESTP